MSTGATEKSLQYCAYSNTTAGKTRTLASSQALPFLTWGWTEGERVWKVLVLCWTLIMFHGHGFELVVEVTHAYYYTCFHTHKYAHMVEDWMHAHAWVTQPLIQSHVHVTSLISNMWLKSFKLSPYVYFPHILCKEEESLVCCYITRNTQKEHQQAVCLDKFLVKAILLS